VKGGHLTDDELQSVLILKDEKPAYFRSQKIDTKNTHGSGCTLSSAIASFLALGKPLPKAVACGLEYTHQAISAGKNLGIGQGNGPLHHFWKWELL